MQRVRCALRLPLSACLRLSRAGSGCHVQAVVCRLSRISYHLQAVTFGLSDVLARGCRVQAVMPLCRLSCAGCYTDMRLSRAGCHGQTSRAWDVVALWSRRRAGHHLIASLNPTPAAFMASPSCCGWDAVSDLMVEYISP